MINLRHYFLMGNKSHSFWAPLKRHICTPDKIFSCLLEEYGPVGDERIFAYINKTLFLLTSDGEYLLLIKKKIIVVFDKNSTAGG